MTAIRAVASPRRISGPVCLFVALVVIGAVVGAQAPDATRPPDQPIALVAGSIVNASGPSKTFHRYGVDLRAGELLDIVVSQDDAAVIIVLTGPDGHEVSNLKFSDVQPVPARVRYIADVTGSYRIDVRLQTRFTGSQMLSDQHHRYTLHVLALAKASESDRARYRCVETLAESNMLARRQTMEALAQAIRLLQETSACARREEDLDLDVLALEFLGQFAAIFSRFRVESAAAYERLVEHYRRVGNTELELASLEDLTREYADDARFDQALATAQAVLALASKVGPRQREVRALYGVGLMAFLLGEYELARRSSTEALRMAAELDDPELTVRALYNLGRLDDLSGNLEAARVRYERGLALKSRDPVAQGLLLMHLGMLHLRQRHYDEAERRLEERLSLTAKMVQREQEAFVRVGLGDVHMARGNRARAQDLYGKAVEALANNEGPYRCIAEERLARLALREGRVEEAAVRFETMIAIAARAAYSSCEAEGHAGVADIALSRGDFGTAEREARLVVDIHERFREAVPDVESRALGFGALAPAFERAVFVTMQAAAHGDRSAAGRAFVLNERAQARALLDRISESAVDVRANVPEGMARERDRVRAEWRTRLAQLQVAIRTPDEAKRSESLTKQIATLEIQLRDLDAARDAIDARGAGFVRPQVLGLDAVQRLLDPETTLLEYALGERQSYVWVVTSSALHAFPIGPRADIDAAARAVHRDLADPSGAAHADAKARRQALARMILAPAAPHVTTRRIVVVASGALALVPFAVLPLGNDEATPLLTRHEVVHTPSATTLAAMRALTTRRSTPRKQAVVFADPIFETDDPRAAAAITVAPAGTTETAGTRALASLGRSLPRLPFSRAEARAIEALRPRDVTTFLDGRATRDRVLAGIADYRFVHFATHGIVHAEVPALSSIALSFVDDRGRLVDPLLTLSDVYEMTLRADVVVLSACTTAGGKGIPGEGVIGLARAFMYAGAPRVVASLWQVNDLATAELMKRFYRGMLIEGRTPAAALHAAQRQLAATPQWSSPYYWAPFVLQGDWR
jgi:CHAT domain-containing protein